MIDTADRPIAGLDPKPDPAAEAETVKLLVSIYVPSDCRIPRSVPGRLTPYLARCLTHYLNESWLPQISTGRRPVALAVDLPGRGEK